MAKNLKLMSGMRTNGTLALPSISAKKSSRLDNFFNRHLCQIADISYKD
jgi:hypothetical protein